MIKKILVLGLVCLSLSFCATSQQGKKVTSSLEIPAGEKIIAEESIMYDNVTPDELWAECIKTLSDINIGEYATNRAAGRIVALKKVKISSFEFPVSREKKADGTYEGGVKIAEITRTKEDIIRVFHLNFLIKESKGGAILACQVAGPESQAKRGKIEMDRFLKSLNKKLKR